jgi:pantoate--beta-alanine ligase
MKILRTLRELREWRASVQAGQTVGFIPTMGALHAGHMKLIETGRSECDVTVVSIFVNPLQFGPGEDFARYPRPFERDSKLCEQAGVDAIFTPEAGEFYAKDHATYCQVEGFDRTLCGASRPGHFRGVCTVVLKLFNLVQPQRAYFGKKDIQQALILCKMVADLSLNLEMVLVDTVREPSGLALSSRNAYLSQDEKERAAALYRALSLARALYQAGERDAEKLKAILRREIEASAPTRIDYVDIVSQDHLEPVSRLDGPAVMALAVFYGKTRLIDNLLLP